jgi:hypothetical protein
MEIRVPVEEWLGKFPDFILSSGAAVKWSAGTVRGPRQIPFTLRNCCSEKIAAFNEANLLFAAGRKSSDWINADRWLAPE